MVAGRGPNRLRSKRQRQIRSRCEVLSFQNNDFEFFDGTNREKFTVAISAARWYVLLICIPNGRILSGSIRFAAIAEIRDAEHGVRLPCGTENRRCTISESYQERRGSDGTNCWPRTGQYAGSTRAVRGQLGAAGADLAGRTYFSARWYRFLTPPDYPLWSQRSPYKPAGGLYGSPYRIRRGLWAAAAAGLGRWTAGIHYILLGLPVYTI